MARIWHSSTARPWAQLTLGPLEYQIMEILWASEVARCVDSSKTTRKPGVHLGDDNR